VIRSDVITRRDGTTAAERFAGKEHGDLCAHLVAIMPTPARPRVRSRKMVEPMLAAACAARTSTSCARPIAVSASAVLVDDGSEQGFNT
jgi:hypothetical protein